MLADADGSIAHVPEALAHGLEVVLVVVGVALPPVPHPAAAASDAELGGLVRVENWN